MKAICCAVISLALLIVLTPRHVLSAERKPLQIAMILWRGETKAEQGFKDGLQALGYTVHYTPMDAKQDSNELGRLLQQDLRPQLSQFDYVYTFGTTVSKATKTVVGDKIPHIFNIVAAPVEAGIVQSLDASGGNISGVMLGIPLSLQLVTALQVVPCKRLGLLFNPRETNSLVIREQLQELGKKLHIEVIDLPSPPDQNLLQDHLQKLVEKSVVVDAVYLPQDSFVISHAERIGSTLKAAKIKSIGGQREYIDHGALMGIIPDYYERGKAAATIVDLHQKGEKLQEIPVVPVTEPVLVINKTTAHLLNVTIPEAMVKKALLIE
jgi:ABC-type uncharacterized transport system substrate-binding protein